MNFNSLIPNFNALGSIDFRKPAIDKGNTVALIVLGAAVLGVIFVFLPWFSLSGDGGSASRLGITTWYGIFGFIFAAVAVAGTLYKQHALAFWAAVLCVLMGLVGWLTVPSLTVEGKELPSELIKLLLIEPKVSAGHLGAILFMLSGLATGACSFMLATGKK